MHSKRAISKFHGEKQFIAKLCVQMQRQGEMWRRVQVWQQGEMRVKVWRHAGTALAKRLFAKWVVKNGIQWPV